MKKNLVNLWGLLFCAIVFYPLTASSQVAEVRNAVRADISIPLRDMKQAKKPFWEKWKRENEMEVPNKFRPVPPGFNPDGAMQQVYNNGAKAVATAPLVNFNGITNASNTGRVTPPDPAGDVGPNHYVQVVNSMLQIFSKTGTSLYGPVQTSTLWSGFSGNWDGHNNGDAIVLYDETADRWIITQFAIDCPGTPKTEYEMVAVSTTGDPTGSYYRYAFQFDYMPDYPKLGVWQDGYYMAVNRFNTNLGTTPFVGAGACVLERSKMLTGDASARMIYFKTETLGGTGSASGSACWSMLPSDCDGTLPAAGTPNYFTYINGTAQLRLWALHADWTTTTNSTFTYVTALTVASYTQMGSGSVPEMGTLSLDGLGDRLMFRNQYRNFGSYETFVTCHNVNTGSSVAGIRWYEYRKTGSAFSLYQQSTYAPGDGKSRWMGSIAMNASGDIGLAYSVSSSTMYPSIYFTGRKASDPLNQMTISEGIIQTGTVSMTSYSRWGDYSAMNVDPSDNTTFWTTQEYVGTYGGWCPWATKVASFKFSSPPVVTTAAATGITMTAATLNGTVNPNGVATTYYFQWGTSVSYGNNTATVSAGSGSSAIAVSANLTGLTSGTTYHFRLAGTNSDGTVYGSDLTFTPPLIPALIVGSINANQAICANATPAQLTGSGPLNGTSPTYQWQSSLNNLTFTNILGATALNYQPGALAASTYFRQLQNATGTTGGPLPTNTVTITINPILPVTVSVAASGNPVCTGTSVTFTASPVNGGTTPAYQWKVNGTNVTGATNSSYNFTPSDGNTISCILTSNAACISGNPATSNTVTMAVNPLLPVSVSIVASTNPICSGSAVMFTATPVNGGSVPAYQWKVNGASITGATNSLYAFIPANGAVITCTLSSNLACVSGNPATSNAITMVVNPALSVGSIGANQAICTNAIPAVLTGSGPLNGTNPTYQWQSSLDNSTFNNISGATSLNYQSGALTSTTYYKQLQNATGTCGGPLPTNIIALTVTPLLPVSLTIAGSANTVCTGTSVTFTATPVNGGTTPAYQWKVNGTSVTGATNSTYSFLPVNGNTITCILTSNATCTTGNPATSNAITMMVNPLLPASVSIAASVNPVCAGNSVMFTATPVNGGTTPAYQWKVNGTSVTGATNSTYSFVPANGNAITCTLTSNATCTTGNPASSNTITMTVNPLLPVSVSVVASAITVCAGTSVTFTATPVNGGTTPAYQWKVNGTSVTGATNSTYSFLPVNGNTITCILTSNATCTTGNPATSNAITMMVNPLLPASVSIAASVNPVCAGNSVMFTATPVNGGTIPAYQWKVNGTSVTGATNSTYSFVPVNGSLITCILTSNATCTTGNPATSNTVTMSVTPLLVVGSISANQTICANAIPAQLTGVAPLNGTLPTYQWQSSLDNNTFSNISGVTSLNYQSGALTSTTYYRQLQNATGTCGGPLPTNTVTITVNPLLPVSVSIVSSANPVCAGTSVTFTATPVNGGTTPGYQWKINGTSVAGATNATYSFVPANGNAISCMLTSNATCTTGNPATSNTVTMTVNPWLVVGSISANQSICANAVPVQLAGVAPLNGTLPTYQWQSSIDNITFNNISGATSLNYQPGALTTTTYYKQLQNAAGTCGGPLPTNSLTITVNPLLPVSVSIAASANTVCAGTSVTFTATPVNGGTIPAYQWKVNGTSVTGATNSTYAFVPVNGNAITCTLTSNATCTTGNPATSNTVTMTVNPLLPVSVSIAASAITVCAGTSVTFTASPVNGGTTPAYQWKVNGTSVTGAQSCNFKYRHHDGEPVAAGKCFYCCFCNHSLCRNFGNVHCNPG
ncbi:MAG: hypothetical protein NT040_01535 [Bacteroidetes bacterium]|nr:hypothetical protein [Bacteroidota bacterium]